MKFSYNLEENLLRLGKELSDQTYQHGNYREFIVHNSKKRCIKAAPFQERVVYHGLCNLIEPIFDKGFIFDSYACRKGKGTHRAIKRLEKFILALRVEKGDDPSKEIYCLKCDISKYFYNIDHKILLEIIKKKIVDKKVIWLIEKILRSSEEESGIGVPIGNLTSQLFANIYLNELDQFIKHTNRIRYYIRYMDDFLVLDFDKKRLQGIKKEIQEFIQKRLKLKFHPKKANIFPIDRIAGSKRNRQGIDFLGYQILISNSITSHRSNRGTYRLLRKSTIKRFIKREKVYKKRLINSQMTREKFNNSLQSWLSYAKFANTFNLIKKLKIHRGPTSILKKGRPALPYK